MAAKKIDALDERLTGEFEAFRTALEARLDEREAAVSAVLEQQGTTASATVDERLNRMDERLERMEALIRTMAESRLQSAPMVAAALAEGTGPPGQEGADAQRPGKAVIDSSEPAARREDDYARPTASVPSGGAGGDSRRTGRDVFFGLAANAQGGMMPDEGLQFASVARLTGAAYTAEARHRSGKTPRT